MGSSFSPQPFGKYFLVDKIATGGMAEIFKAKTYGHGGFEQVLVIKRILSHLGENEDFVDMFIDEAKVSVALQHPNIVRIYDFGKIIDNYFIAMECVEGKDARNLLRKLARARRLLPIEFACLIAYETCKGLHYAHEKKDLHGKAYDIVHRDMSPSNVIISYEGEVKVADFGIAKAESNAYETQDGVLKGKYEYMSPEQADGIPLDKRSDLFSVGIIFHELLTGRRLFKTKNDMMTLKKIKKGGVTPPSELSGRIPPEIDAIVMKALATDPEDRWQTAEAMGNAIRGYLLPENADAIQQRFSKFMAELFEEEIEQELTRLKSGSAIAEQMKDQLPLDHWDGTTNSTMGNQNTGVNQTAPVWPLLVGMGGLLIALAVVVGVGGFAMSQIMDQEEQVAPVTGSLDIMVLPEATITVDGVARGAHGMLTLEDLAEGEHNVKLEADGYETMEVAVVVLPGKKAVLQKTLVKAKAEPQPTASPDPKPQPTTSPSPRPQPTGPPKVRITSTPAGASVLIDGTPVGTTPMTWTEGSAGGSYKVTLSLDGHMPVSGTVSGLSKGRTASFSRTLEEANEPGNLKVVIAGGGWGNVFVNGKKQKKTAPLSIELMPGSYTVRVVNEPAGLDYTEQVTVKPGDTTAVQAQ